MFSSAEQFDVLNLLYSELLNHLMLEKKRLISNSVLFSLIKMSSGDRLRFLTQAQINISNSQENCIYNELEDEGYLKKFIQNNEIFLVFSAQGLFKVEETKNGMDQGKILAFLQEEYFDFDELTKSLIAKEKVVLLSLLLMHCYNESLCMNLSDETHQDIWFKIMNDNVIPFMKEVNLIPVHADIFPESTGNEKPVVYVMKRQNNLSKKTANLFSNPGNRKYWLKLTLEDKAHALNLLVHMFKLILPKKITFDTILSLKSFLEVTYRYFDPLLRSQFREDDEEWSNLINQSLDWVLLQ